jgi:hypothetical protein
MKAIFYVPAMALSQKTQNRWMHQIIGAAIQFIVAIISASDIVS